MCQFRIEDLDLSNNDNENIDVNIFNKEITSPKEVYNKIINNETVARYEIEYINPDISKQKPKDKKELLKIIRFYSEHYPNESLNWLDVSEITDMSFLFNGSKYNGDISKWDVSNVTTMAGMFAESQFNQNISNWNVSKVKSMAGLFAQSQFKQDISKWNISNLTIKDHMWE